MPIFTVSRYSVKSSDSQFFDRNELTDEEKVIWDNYVTEFVHKDEHYVNTFNSVGPESDVRGDPKVMIDENTMKVSYVLRAPDGKEQMIANNFIRKLGTSDDPYRLAYIDMIREKGSSIDISKSYWEIKYANNHVQIYNFGNQS